MTYHHETAEFLLGKNVLTTGEEDNKVYLSGRHVDALYAWKVAEFVLSIAFIWVIQQYNYSRNIELWTTVKP